MNLPGPKRVTTKALPRLLLPFLVGLGAVTSACTSPAEAAILDCGDLEGLLSAFHHVHYSVRSPNQALKTRAIEQFVEGLDPSRSLLTKSEVEGMKSDILGAFDAIESGQCRSLSDAFALIRKRAAEDTTLAKKFLKGDFKVDPSIELVVDPEERGYPITQAARQELARTLVHFQMANYLNGGIELAKAKKQLIHRYELTEKRLAEKAEQERLPEMFAEAFARAMDPHSAYLSHDALMDFQIHMRLSLEGIGAALRTEDGFTYIESLIPGGGAEKSGKLRPKDKIIAVRQDGEEPVSTIDMSIRDVVKLIRGRKGTKVTLTILREGSTTRTFDVTIVRDTIDVKQQAAKLEIETRRKGKRKLKVGIIELPSFYGSAGEEDGRSSYEDMKRLIEEAKAEKVRALVLDLSKNGGGYLEDAVRISGLFLRKGAVVSTKEASGDETVLRDTDSRTEWSGPLVVVVSPMSASASEILAGSLHAYGRALVVGAGTQSFGKGSVQTLRALPRNLGAMKITTGMYFLPDGHSTQQTGVDVDLVVPSILSTIEVGEKDLDYSLPPQSTTPFLSDQVNGSGEDRWVPVDVPTVAALTKLSQQRVKSKKAFKEIREAIEEAKKKKDKIAISDILKKEDDAAKSNVSKRDQKDKNQPSKEQEDENKYERMEETFLDEAVDIALDLASKLRTRPDLGARAPMQDRQGR